MITVTSVCMQEMLVLPQCNSPVRPSRPARSVAHPTVCCGHVGLANRGTTVSLAILTGRHAAHWNTGVLRITFEVRHLLLFPVSICQGQNSSGRGSRNPASIHPKSPELREHFASSSTKGDITLSMCGADSFEMSMTSWIRFNSRRRVSC